jgi:cytidylate kinase
VSQLSSLQISFKFNIEKGFAEVYLNNENIEDYIRTLEVSKYVSLIAEVSEVRQQLVDQQKKFGKHKGVVMDGRDIGTVVFPDAELKLFMTASAEKRAKRRYDELLQRGEEVSYDAVLKNVQTRDFIDSNREDSPLTMAEGAVKVDNSNMTLEEQFDFVFNQSEQKINELHKKKQH